MKKYSFFFLIIAVAFASCVKDRVTSASTGGGNLGTRVLVHYWNFNSSDTSVMLTPTYTAGGGFISYVAGYFDAVTPGSLLNARNGDDSGSGLRMRNPYTSVTIHLPTTGYTKPILTFATQRSSSGPSSNNVMYTLDGTNFISTGLSASSFTIGTSWTEFSFDFSSISGADNNPNFAVKFIPTNNDTGSSGNDRYDNITLDGIPTGSTPTDTSVKLLHYWDFNANDVIANAVLPTSSIGGASLLYGGAYWDTVQAGSTLNIQNGDAAGNALRLRNPATGPFTMTIPTTGYNNVVLKYAVMRTSSGAASNTLTYSIDGTNFDSTGITQATYSVGTAFQLVTYDFSAISGVSNNPNFKVQINFGNGNTNTSGNDRYDNISVTGKKL